MKPASRFSMDSTPAAPPSADHTQGIDPSLANLDWDWLASMAALGFTIAAVECKDIQQVLHLAGPGFERGIGEALEAAETGHFDSMKRGDPFTLFYCLHASKLPTALQLLKTQLDVLNLLPLAKIGYADVAEGVWRTWTEPK